MTPPGTQEAQESLRTNIVCYLQELSKQEGGRYGNADSEWFF